MKPERAKRLKKEARVGRGLDVPLNNKPGKATAGTEGSYESHQACTYLPFISKKCYRIGLCLSRQRQFDGADSNANSDP